MNGKPKFTLNFLVSVAGALLVLICGLILLHFNFRLGKRFLRSSYDWSFDLAAFMRPHFQSSDVVLIYMDEWSYKELNQPFNKPWDRALHAKLIDRLTLDGAKAVAFDILFTDPGPDIKADEEFARAIKSNGRVILAADNAPTHQAAQGQVTIPSKTLTPPYEMFETVAAGWGLAQLSPDEDFIIREHYHGSRDQSYPSLTWATAELVGLDISNDPAQRLKERWINYYGRPETIPHISYSRAHEMRPGFFRDKVVFIGARPMGGSYIERRDELRSPFFTWHQNFLFMPMVEVHATQFANLLRKDWLVRLSPAYESTMVLAVAILFGFGLNRFRPLAASGVAFLGMLAVMALAVYLFGQMNFWFPWMILVFAQIPMALLWAVLCKSIQWYVTKRKMEGERREAEVRIREQAALLDKAQDAIAVRDLHGQLHYWNKSSERLYGWSTAEALGKNANELFFPNGLPQPMDACQRVLEQGEWLGELDQLTKDNKKITVESRWTLVRDDAGKPKSILIISTDITEKKKLEAQFLRAQRMESIGTLAGGIAHDLNNVLTPIILSVELLRMGKPDERSQKFLNTVEASAKRGADMVKQVLSFARGHEGERTAVQLTHLIKEMDKIIKETFPKSIQVKSRYTAQLPTVMGDATQLHQILLNFCVNARDAMPEGGEIYIVAEPRQVTEADAKHMTVVGGKPGNYIAFSVTDSGTGIPPEIIDRIFEPFFTTKEVGKGTGLGLSTVISIVKSHGGFLDLKSEIGKGTIFTVYLPAVEAPVHEAVAKTPRELLMGHGEFVLVVDDEPAIREMLKHSLTIHGYQVLTAAHGAEAVAVSNEYKDKISLAVVDMMMPVMDGPKTIQALGKLQPTMKFVAMSGLMQGDKFKEKIDPAEVPFLPKPFATEKLLEHLRQMLALGANPLVEAA